MRALHTIEGQTGTLFIRDGGERLECGIGAPGQPISTYLPIRPEEPMAIYMGTDGWFLGHYRPNAPMTREETYLHWFVGQYETRCGLFTGMRVACGISVPQSRETMSEDDGERLELPPRRGMFVFSEGEPTLLLSIPERQRIPLRDDTWFKIYLGGVWLWGKYRPGTGEDPAGAHLFYLNEGTAYKSFCSLLPGMTIALP